MQNKMLSIITSISNNTLVSETELRDFRKKDYLETIIDHLEKRLKFLEIENTIKFNGCKKVYNYTKHKSLCSFSSLFQIECNFEIFNIESGEWEDMSFPVNFPQLVDNMYFYLNGSKYFLVLSLASRTHVHSKEKVIFKHFNEMLVLELDGIPSFNYNGKRVNLFLALYQQLLFDGKALSAFLTEVYGDKFEIVGIGYPGLAMRNHIVFKDFIILIPRKLSGVQIPITKSLEKLKKLTSNDFNDLETITGLLSSIFGTKTSLKTKTLIEENRKFIDQIGIHTILKEIEINVNNDFENIQMRDEPVFAETIADELFKYMKGVRKTYIGSHLKSHNKLMQVFNKPVLKDCVLIGLFKNRLLQYDDSVNNIPKELKVSLVNSSGRKVSSKSREVNNEYYKKLGLFLTSNGKSVGSVAFLAPI